MNAQSTAQDLADGLPVEGQASAEEPGAAIALPPPNPLLAVVQSLLPFPSHWDSQLRLSSQALFAQGRLDEAVRDATLRLEARLRALCGAPADRIGTDLVGDAFKPDGGFLEPVSLPKAEREGVFALYRGAIQQIRNPVGHRAVGQHPGPAFDTIAFVNYLLGVAEQAALERYVYPFVGRWAGPTLIQGIHHRDLNGDGDEEIVVVTTGGLSAGQRQAAVLVLAKGGLSPLPGFIEPMPAEIVSGPAFEDLDGDGRPELLLSGGVQTDGRWLWSGSILDCGADGRFATYGATEEAFKSAQLPFEVLRPMHIDGPTVAAWTDAGGYEYWKFNGAQLTRQSQDTPDA